MKAFITDNDKLCLIGLLTLAKRHNAVLKEIERAALEITGDNDMGHTCDAVYCDYDIEELLSKLKLPVGDPLAALSEDQS